MSSAMLEGRKVLITGASGGLGEHFARICAAAGATVVLGARRIDRLATIVDGIAATGGRALAVPMDVTSELSVQQAFDQAESEVGPLDSIVANAGIEKSGSVDTLDVDDWDTVFAVNVRGVFLTAREAAKRMRAAGITERGRIVLISSITAALTGSGDAAYSSSKAAVNHLGRTLAREWVNQGVNVNTISPGYIMTELSEGFLSGESGKAFIAGFRRKRIMPTAALNDSCVERLALRVGRSHLVTLFHEGAARHQVLAPCGDADAQQGDASTHCHAIDPRVSVEPVGNSEADDRQHTDD